MSISIKKRVIKLIMAQLLIQHEKMCSYYAHYGLRKKPLLYTLR